ncbi:MAG: DsbA family protein [Thermoleophilaceae bacterium]
MSSLRTTLYSDPGCPWGYSANPALAVLRWRYGSALDWRFVAIGLTESAQQYVDRGYTPVKQARGYRNFRKYGMPFATEPRVRITGTSPACRAIVATRRLHPGREWAVYRALQFGWFTTALVLDEPDDIRTAIASVPGIDADAVVAAIESPEVLEEYEGDRDQARTAAASPTEFQGKSANSDGRVRYTAPSVVFETEDGRTLEAGGWQTIEAYDVLVANLDPTLERRLPGEVGEMLAEFPDGLTTEEVAALLVRGNDDRDRAAAEDALIELTAGGGARRVPLGDDALWVPATADVVELREAA